MTSTYIQNKAGRLYLIPNIIHPGTENKVIAQAILSAIQEVDLFLVENVRTARRYLGSLIKMLPEDKKISIEKLEFEQMDKDTTTEVISKLLQPAQSGKIYGIISESGCPGIADPGSEAVKTAHRMNIDVVPLPGPSSIFLALMASGMNGQAFTFNGYLPIEKHQLASEIKKLEKEARIQNKTQIFIETPYRNQRMFEALLSNCSNDVSLCIAAGITGPEAMIKTMAIAEWKLDVMTFKKVPVVFLLSI